MGGWLGISQYYGDLNNEINLNAPGLAGGILGKYNYNSRVSIRGSLNYGSISADDSKSDNNFNRNRNLSFKSNIFDLTSGFEFNFLKHERGSKFNTYTPFIFAGISLLSYNPTAEYEGKTYDLQKLGTEGQDRGEEYLLFTGAYTLGAGFKWDISSDVTLTAEFTTRRTFTDYLDDVSATYPDANRLLAIRGATAVNLSNRALKDGIGEEGRQRGISNNKDRYTFLSISITKYFGQLECPKISRI